MGQINSKVLCKDCKHSRVGWFMYLLDFGSPKSYAYKCSKYTIGGRYDPVLGTTTDERMGSCSGARTDMVCGPLADKWEARDSKRQLFTIIKRS